MRRILMRLFDVLSRDPRELDELVEASAFWFDGFRV